MQNRIIQSIGLLVEKTFLVLNAWILCVVIYRSFQYWEKMGSLNSSALFGRWFANLWLFLWVCYLLMMGISWSKNKSLRKLSLFFSSLIVLCYLLGIIKLF